MKGHLRIGSLVWSILFAGLIAAVNIPIGFIGSALWMADGKLSVNPTLFVVCWGILNVSLIALYVTRKKWQRSVDYWLYRFRFGTGLVDQDEEVEYLEQKVATDGEDPHLIAKQAIALDRRYKDNPEIPLLYAKAIDGLADVDTKQAVTLFTTYFPRFQKVFEGPIQLKLARALRPQDPDMAARSLELWLLQNKDLSPVRCEILMFTAQIIERDLGLKDAAKVHYQRVVQEFPKTQSAENAANRLALLRSRN